MGLSVFRYRLCDRHNHRRRYERRGRFERLEDRRLLANTYLVNTADDEFNFTGLQSLREAAFLATSPGDMIQFDPDEVDGATIRLTLGEEIPLANSLTIDASMLPNGITIDACDFDRGSGNEERGNGNRVFNISDLTMGAAPPSVVLKNLTLTGGDILSTPGDDDAGQGGAIRSEGLLTLEQCTVFGNYASTGGGIYVNVKGHEASRQVLTINDSLLGNVEDAANANRAALDGGAVAVLFSGDATNADRVEINRSEISHNFSGSNGGGLYVVGNSLPQSVVEHEVIK